MKRFFTVPVLLSLAALSFAMMFGAPFIDGDSLSNAGLAVAGIGATAAAVARSDIPAARLRIREDLQAFQNVVASGRAFTEIPRYAMTAHRITLRLGGTSFTKAMVTEIRIKVGAKTIFLCTGSALQKLNAYKALWSDASFLTIDFTQPNDKTRAGEFVGGMDMTALPEGQVRLEVVTSGATAPTLTGKITWGPPQGNRLVQMVKEYTWGSGTATGKQAVPLDFGGALVQRLFIQYTGTDWCGASATSSAWSGNTGNGTMGAITVAADTKVGTWKLAIIEPGANVGTFLVTDPDGVTVSVRGVVASAFSGGGLSFTLADGSTDFVAGDGFDIVVASTTDGNVNRVEVKKDGRTQWDYSCADSRFMQREFGHVPQSKQYVVDFLADNYSDGVLVTAGAQSLELSIWLTAADNLTIYAEVLDLPENA